MGSLQDESEVWQILPGRMGGKRQVSERGFCQVKVSSWI